MKSKTTNLILCLLLMALFISTNVLGAPKPKRGVQVTPKSAPALDSLYQNSYAVIIGVNHYDKWPSLEYAVNDAKAIEKRLKDLGFETTTLIDHSATRSNIMRLLGDELPRKVDKNDRVVIFFAGHGQTEELADGSQMGYIVPVDGDTRDLFSTAISMEQVRNFSKRIMAKHVLYLMDSCYSGLGLTRSGAIPPSDRDYLRKITTRKAHQMLTAGGKGEQSQEEGAHGLFTKYVLEALDGHADRDEKGYITFSDLASYVKPKVSRESGNSQTPQYGNIAGEGEFVFVLAGLPAAKGKAEQERITREASQREAKLQAEQERIAREAAQREAKLQAELKAAQVELQREEAEKKQDIQQAAVTAAVQKNTASSPGVGLGRFDGTYRGQWCSQTCRLVTVTVKQGTVSGSWLPAPPRQRSYLKGTITPEGAVILTLEAFDSKGRSITGTMTGKWSDEKITTLGMWHHNNLTVEGLWTREP